jgi:hypothetical protein
VISQVKQSKHSMSSRRDSELDEPGMASDETDEEDLWDEVVVPPVQDNLSLPLTAANTTTLSYGVEGQAYNLDEEEESEQRPNIEITLKVQPVKGGNGGGGTSKDAEKCVVLKNCVSCHKSINCAFLLIFYPTSTIMTMFSTLLMHFNCVVCAQEEATACYIPCRTAPAYRRS